MAVLDIEDAVIADGDPVGVSAEVLKNTLGAIEGRLTIDDPLLVIKMPPEGLEGSGLFEMADAAVERKRPLFEAAIEEIQELAFEQR